MSADILAWENKAIVLDSMQRFAEAMAAIDLCADASPNEGQRVGAQRGYLPRHGAL